MPKYEANEAEDDLAALNDLLDRISNLHGEVVSVVWRPALDTTEEGFDGSVTVIKRPSGYVVTYKL